MQVLKNINAGSTGALLAASAQRRVLLRWTLAALVGGAVGGWLLLGPGITEAWNAVQSNLGAWQTWAGQHPHSAVVSFFLVYATTTALPLPCLTVMSLLAGALFGRLVGTGVACIAYTAGVTTAFLAARWLLRERVRQSAGAWLGRIERGVERDGAFYLLTLRLMPSVPFFLVNVFMALTPIRTRTYAVISLVGVLPITFLYAGVGTELAGLDSPTGLLSLRVLGSLVVLALAPLVVRMGLRWSGYSGVQAAT